MALAKASFKRSFKSKGKREPVASAAEPALVTGAAASEEGGEGGGEAGDPVVSAWRPDLDCSGALAVPEDMPKDALPQGPRRGKLNYTVYARGLDGPRIEVQLKNKCFYLKKSGSGPVEGPKVVSWSKLGSIAVAWDEATERTAWYSLAA
jgi:hypothetical protein